MSSFRNAVKRKTHKERAQPAARSRFGLLEKHKDYVERARDFHKKQNQIKILREKAAFRNPDEFYFKMQSSSTKRGVHQVNRDNSLDDDTIKLLKSQLQTEKKKLEKMEGDLHCLSAMAAIPKQNKHTIFLDSDEEPEDLDLAEYFDTCKRRKREDILRSLNEKNESENWMKAFAYPCPFPSGNFEYISYDFVVGLEVRRLDEDNISAELAVSSLSAVSLGSKSVGGSVLVVEGLELQKNKFHYFTTIPHINASSSYSPQHARTEQ
eukprot:751909-Hanusia_phi.AAC.1